MKKTIQNKVKHPCNSDNSGTVCISARTTRTSKTVRFPYRQGLHHKKRRNVAAGLSDTALEQIRQAAWFKTRSPA